jgi:hypothetical protein
MSNELEKATLFGIEAIEAVLEDHQSELTESTTHLLTRIRQIMRGALKGEIDGEQVLAYVLKHYKPMQVYPDLIDAGNAMATELSRGTYEPPKLVEIWETLYENAVFDATDAK